MPPAHQTLTEYFRNARARGRRRRSGWNVLLLPIAFGAWAAIWYGMFRLVWAFHAAVYPAHRLADFWQAGVSARSFVLSFIMVFALTPSAMTLGFMLADALVWLIPAARRSLDAEARGIVRASFRDSISDLGKVCLLTLPLGIVLSLAAAYGLKSLR
jgi:hypothetical protein